LTPLGSPGRAQSKTAKSEASADIPVAEATAAPEEPENLQESALEQENQLLQHELDSLFDRTRNVERQIMEIAELQQVFASKVSQQDQEIDLNFQAAVAAKARVDTGAKHLRKAMKKGVDFRVFVLLFLIVLSVSLLFLDHIT